MGNTEGRAKWIRSLWENSMQIIKSLIEDRIKTSFVQQWDKVKTISKIKAEIKENINGRLSENEYGEISKFSKLDLDWGKLSIYYTKRRNIIRLVECYYEISDNRFEKERQKLIDEALEVGHAVDKETQSFVIQYMRKVFEVVDETLAARVDPNVWAASHISYEQLKARFDNRDMLFDRRLRKLEDEHQRLLRETQFAGYVDSLNLPEPISDPMNFRNNIITFEGRNSELGRIDAFLNKPERLLWMAITGDGGIGKSKLLFAFTGSEIFCKYESTWKAVWVTKEIVEKCISEFREWNYSKNLLLIVDNVGVCAEQVGKWIYLLLRSENRPSKIRFILVERETVIQDEVDFKQPYWYQMLINDHRDDIRLSMHEGLLLGTITREALSKVIYNYAKSQSSELNEDDIELILKLLNEIDPNKNRVLIAMFITDVFLNGFTDNTIDTLTSYVVEKYEKYWKNTIFREESKKAAYPAFINLLAYATATDGQKVDTLENMPVPLNNDAAALLKLQPDELEQIIADINRSNERDILRPFEPDILGECFVMERLKSFDLRPTTQKQLFDAMWSKDADFFFEFMNRCIFNYAASAQYAESFMTWFGRMELSDSKCLPLYCMLICNLISIQDFEKGKDTISHLKSVIDSKEDKVKYAIFYLHALANLIMNGNLDEIRDSISEMKRLADDSDDVQGQIIYCSVLLDISNLEKEEGRKNIAEEVRHIHDCHPDNEDITVLYAHTLNNLAFIQTSEACFETVKMIDALRKEYPNLDAVGSAYAMGLVNLSKTQDFQESNRTVSILKQLHNENPDLLEYQNFYMQGLSNLTLTASGELCLKIIDEIKGIVTDAPQIPDFLIPYAKALFNTIHTVGSELCKAQINEMNELYKSHNDIAEIALEYSKMVRLLTPESDEKALKETMDELKVIYERFPDYEELAVQYTYSIRFYWLDKGVEIPHGVAEDLAMLNKKFATNHEIAYEYAQMLVNILYAQNAVDCADMEEEISRLHKTFPQSIDIAIAYIRWTGRFTCNDESDCTEAITNQYKDLIDQYPDCQEVVDEIADMLARYAYCKKEDCTQCENIVLELRRIYENNKSCKIANCYASALLSHTYDYSKSRMCVNEIGKLCDDYPDDEKLKTMHSQALFNLCCDTPQAEREKVIDELRILSKKYSGISAVEKLYKMAIEKLLP